MKLFLPNRARIAAGTAALLAALALAGAAAPATAQFHEGWHRGHWEHGWHDGRWGWWWFTGGLWYMYNAPVYPYPAYPYPAPPPVVLQPQPAPPTVVPQTTQYWYYCDEAKGYYPYVPTCPGPWRAVPAMPAQAAH